MLEKWRQRLYAISNFLELVIALVVIAGILIAMCGLGHEVVLFWNQREQAGAFYEFLDVVFEIVISIEFLKMLCQPGADTVIEVLIFLVSRHMIIHETTQIGDLISIVSIALLFAIRKYIHTPAKKNITGKPFASKDGPQKESEGDSQKDNEGGF